eukprot:2877073-Rhodomonas_salina.1
MGLRVREMGLKVSGAVWGACGGGAGAADVEADGACPRIATSHIATFEAHIATEANSHISTWVHGHMARAGVCVVLRRCTVVLLPTTSSSVCGTEAVHCVGGRWYQLEPASRTLHASVYANEPSKPAELVGQVSAQRRGRRRKEGEGRREKGEGRREKEREEEREERSRKEWEDEEGERRRRSEEERVAEEEKGGEGGSEG